MRADPAAPLPALHGASVLWRRPSADEWVAGFGTAGAFFGAGAADRASAARVRWIGDPASALPGPWFGGWAFDSARARAAEWVAFGDARFALPHLLVWQRGGERVVAAFCRAHDEREAARELDAALARAATELQASPPPERGAGRVELDDSPRGAWTAGVDAALARIRRGELEKVVLARRLRARATAPIAAVELVEALALRHPSSASFALAADGAVFAGATPEALLHLEGRSLAVDALAGTLAPGEASASEKEVREHGFVVEAVRSALEHLCADVSAAASPEVLELAHLSHLKTTVRATLAEGAALGELLRRLHPTPAVGGTPREAAVRFIREQEDFDRGWYAGAVGWIGEGAAHLSVAIRSALVRGQEAFVYVGAGIVQGSSADREWEETARKARTVLEALEACG